MTIFPTNPVTGATSASASMGQDPLGSMWYDSTQTNLSTYSISGLRTSTVLPQSPGVPYTTTSGYTIDAACVYAPYIPLQITTTHIPTTSYVGNWTYTSPNITINPNQIEAVNFVDEEGETTTISREDLIKYIRVQKSLNENDDIVKTLWDRVQVAVKLIS